MPITAQLADGRILEFPDGTDPAVIQSTVKRIIAESPQEKGAGFSLSDLASSFMQGAYGSTQALTDVLGAGNVASQALEERARASQAGMSAARQAELARQQERSKKAEQSGSTWEEIKAAAQNIAEAPLQSAAQAVGSFVPYLPTMFLGPAAGVLGLGARATAAATAVARGAPAVIGTAQGAGAVKGAIYDAVYEAEVKDGRPPEEARAKALAAQEYAGENIDQIATGAGLGLAAGKFGAESLLRPGAAATASRSMAGRIGMAAAADVPTEALQGGQERLAANIALQREGYDVPTFQGVAGQAAQEGLLGLLGSAPVAAVRGPDVDALRQEELKKQAEAFEAEKARALAEVGTRMPEREIDLPGGFKIRREEVSREAVPESFGLFVEGAEAPLTTVPTQEEAQAKLESFTQIREKEREDTLAQIEKLNEEVQKRRERIDYLEATGQTATEEYQQAKATLPQQEEAAETKARELAERIETLGKPVTITPIGQREAVQERFNVISPTGKLFETHATQGEAEASVRNLLGEEVFKEAELKKGRDERIAQLEKELVPAMQKFGLKDVALKVVDQIENNAGGAYLNKLIRVAYDEPKPLQTMRHESVHALKDLGFFTPQQWKALEERAKKQWIKEFLENQTTEIDGQQMSRLEGYRKIGYSEDAIIEEAIADAFGAYDKGATPPPGLIASLFKKLKNFFTNFGQALRGAGFESADDIFQRVERGELKPSKAKAEKAAPKSEPKKELKEEPEAQKFSLAGAGIDRSTRNLMEQKAGSAQIQLGLKTEKAKGATGANNVRDVAKALNQYTLDQFGGIDKSNPTAQDVEDLATAVADEVGYQLRASAKTGTGLGWYSNNYPNAVKRLGARFPELKENKHARSVFSALVAVTSNGEDVSTNIKNAIRLYADLRQGKPLVPVGSRRADALTNNLVQIQSLLDKYGEGFEKELTKEITVAQMNAYLRSVGEKPSGDYLANTKIPAAAIYFGPKLGAFYANLSGSEGYLTMDLWWTRSINRMRGLLVPQATQNSINTFRELMELPSATREEVIAAAVPFKQKYEQHGYVTDLEFLAGSKEPDKAGYPKWIAKAKRKAGPAFEQLMLEHKLEKLGNTIYKNEYEMLKEDPFNASDRKFMYDVARKAQQKLRSEGIDLSLADIQAALWYYEKRLYAKLTGREADDIGYEEAIIAQSAEGDRREGPSVVFSEQPDRRDEARGKGAVPDESGRVDASKLSLRKGIVAEVAPNPDHISAELWREMTPQERFDATKAVANKTMFGVFSELGLKGYNYQFSSGKYEGELNPNIIVEAPEDATTQELDELARVLGYVLDQKAMVTFDENNKTSGSQAGFVQVVIPERMKESDVNELRNYIARSVPQASGDTLRNGSLFFGNFSAYDDSVDTLTDKQYHQAIVDAINEFGYVGDIEVYEPMRFHSDLVEASKREDYLEGTRYGERDTQEVQAGRDTVRGQERRRLEALAESAIALRDRWIDARGAARQRGGAGDNAIRIGDVQAEYGTPRPNSVSAIGVHFSKQQRPVISTAFYGSGLRGLERDRLMDPRNADIRNRSYFYVDKGRGINPESGVGGVPHVIKLNNLYDVVKDPLQIVKRAKGETAEERRNNWERGVKAAGFDGYLLNDPLQQNGYAVLVGKHDVNTSKLSLRNVAFPSVKAVKEAVAGVTAPDTREFKLFLGASQLVNEDKKAKIFYHGTVGEFFEFKPSGQSEAIFIADTPEEAETFADVAMDRQRKKIYENLLDKAQKLEMFQRIVDAEVEKGNITAKYGKEFMRDAKQRAPKYGDFGDIEQQVYDALEELSPAQRAIYPLYVRAETPFEFDNPDHVNQVISYIEHNIPYQPEPSKEAKEEARKLGVPTAYPQNKLAGLKGNIVQGRWRFIEHPHVQKALRDLGFDGFSVQEGPASRKNYAVYSPTQVKSVTGNLGDFSAENKDIRYSLPKMPTALDTRVSETTATRDPQNFAERITKAISPQGFSYFRQKAINRYNQLSVYDRKLVEQMGGKELLADQSAEAAALMSDLGAGVAASAMGIGDRHGGIPVYKNGVTTIDRSKKGLIAVLQPLARYGDPKIYQYYQYWAMVKRGVRLNAEGKTTGIDNTDVQYAKYLESKFPEFVTVQKEFIEFNNGLVKYARDTGVISADQAQAFMKHADYVPFYRQMDGETTVGPNIFQSIAGVRPPKKLKGGTAPLADFLETAVRNTQSMIQAGMKNAAAQRVVDVATKVKAPGMGAERLDYNPPMTPDIFQVLENGKIVSYRTPDHLLLDAVSSLNMAELPFMGILSAPANALRNLVTKDPGFMMANLMRDSLSAWVTSGQKMTPIAGTVINFGKALAGKSKGFEALIDAGVIGGYELSQNIERSGQELEDDLAKKAGKKAPLPLRPFTSLWEGLEKGTTASDAATRALVYERVMKETGNEAEALFRALEVMNFNRKGNSPLIRVLTAAVPFLNARIQGLDVFYRASTGNMNMADKKAIQRKFWVRGASMMAMSCYYYMLVHDDDDYKKQEQETKDNNWIIPSLGLRIPIPFEVGVLFKTIPERIMAYSFGNDTGQDFMDSMKRNAISTFAFNPIPQTVKPLVEATTNFNFFTWREIVGQGMQDVAPEFQVGPGTSKIAKAIGESLGLSPIKVDHIIKGYTGTMGMYAIDTIDYLMDQFSDSPKAAKRFEQMPVIKRFAVDPEARGTVTAYYQLKDSVDTTVRTMNLLERSMEPEKFAKYVQDNIGPLAVKDHVRDMEKTMKETREMRQAIQASPMSAEEKRDALSAITQAENHLTSNIQDLKKVIASLK